MALKFCRPCGERWGVASIWNVNEWEIDECSGCGGVTMTASAGLWKVTVERARAALKERKANELQSKHDPD